MTIQETLRPFVVDKPHPLLEARTIQLVLLREILDYTVLRTEETRELNVVTTPLSVTNPANERRVAFLATKQKSAESRMLEQMLRTANRELGRVVSECYLKDGLCLECPRCGLFGGTNVESGSEKIGNIRHRIEYGTAFSLMPFKDIGSAITFNAIDDVTQKTGQALGTRYAVLPASLFPSIVTLRSVTWREFVLVIKTLLACKSYGAESRIGGDARNTIVGIVAGWEEVLTPLELTLELYARSMETGTPPDTKMVQGVLSDYTAYAGNPKEVTVFEPNQVAQLVDEAAKTELNDEFLRIAYSDIADYRKVQKEGIKRK